MINYKTLTYMNSISSIILQAIIMILLDCVYLFSFGSYFKDMISFIQKERFTVNWIGVIGCYIFLFLSYYKFIVMDRKNEYDAFILGLSLYGVFNFTNIALFKNYNIFYSLIDTLWGGILFYLTNRLNQLIHY